MGIDSAIGNRTYTPTTFSIDEILQNHASVLNTLNIPGHVDNHNELPYQHLTKMHCWFQKMFYKTSVSAPYKNINCCE
jgi:hypothetical protein